MDERDVAGEAGGEGAAATAILRAHRRFGTRLTGSLAAGAGTAVTVLLLVAVLAWVTDLGVLGVPFRVAAPRLDPGAALSALSVLAAISIGLQVAVRMMPGAAGADMEEALGRQAWLARFAAIVVAATIGVGMLASVPALLEVRGAPDSGDVDPGGIAGPLGLSVLIAVVAADAAIATDPRYSFDARRAAWEDERRVELQDGRRIVSGGGRMPSVGRAVVECVVAVGGIAVIGVVAMAIAAGWSLGGAALGALIGAGSVALAAGTAGGVWLCVARRDVWSLGAIGLLAAAVMAIAVLLLVAVSLGLAATSGAGVAVRVSIAMGVIVALALGAGGALARRATPSRVVGPVSAFVVGRLDAELRRLDGARRARREPMNGLAVAALAVSVVPPLSFPLAAAARAQIEAGRGPQRGRRLADAAVAIGWGVLALAVVAAVALAVVARSAL